MFADACEMLGYSVSASDGTIGVVCDLLFEESTWIIRYLVVNTSRLQIMGQLTPETLQLQLQAQEAVVTATESYIAGLYAHNIAKASIARAIGLAVDAGSDLSGGRR